MRAKVEVRGLIGDAVPRVRTFATMAAGKLGDREAMGAVTGLLDCQRVTVDWVLPV